MCTANAELVLDFDHPTTWRVGVNQKCGDAFRTLAGVGHRHQDNGVGVITVSNPVLDAVDNVIVAIAHSSCSLGCGVRTGARFTERECPKHPPTCQRYQQLTLLLFGAKLLDPVAHQRVIHRGDHTQ